MGPTLPMKITAGAYLLTPKADTEPIEEQPFDFSRKYNELLDEPERKSRTECPAYQDDDMPRVYCTEGTPRLTSRASSVGDLTNSDKRRPKTILEHEEVQIASHTATANATPRMWSRGSSPNSLNSFCMAGTNNFDANSVASEFSPQPSGVISPSDLPDSPGQTMPSSPKRSNRVYAPTAKHICEYNYTSPPDPPPPPPVHVHLSNTAATSLFTPISLAEEKNGMKSPGTATIHRPNPEPRHLRSFREKPTALVGEQFIQEDSLHNYRTEDTPANLSAATSFSELSGICPKSDYSKSDYSRPIPQPRKILPKPPNPLTPNDPRNKSMPNLHKVDSDSSECDTEDDELLRETITKGRPSNRNKSNGNLVTKPFASKRTQDDKGDSDSDPEQQKILNELIKMGRPSSRVQSRIKTKTDMDSEAHFSQKSDRFKSARSMENLTPSKVVKKGVTNFRVREQPLRGAENLPKNAVTRAQSLKGNKSLTYDPVHDRRQSKTPEPNEQTFDTVYAHQNKPISKVSPMRSIQPSTSSIPSTSGTLRKGTEDVEDTCLKQGLLSPLRSSVRQSRQTAVKKTELSGELSDVGGEESPPLPPKPAQYRTLTRPTTEKPSTSSSMENILSAMPDLVSSTGDSQPVEENNNSEILYDFPPEPAEDSGDITVLRFKFAESKRSYTRRFLASNQFTTVINYLTCKGFPPDKYKVIVSSVLLIKREITESCFEKTLDQLKMVPKKTLTVKPR